MKNRKVLVLEKGGEDFFALCWNAKYLRNEGMILLILMVLAELRGPERRVNTYSMITVLETFRHKYNSKL